MNRVPVRETAKGRWRRVLSALGVEARYLRNQHGPCPLGCDGKRSWRWDDKDGDGTGICTHCGAVGGMDIAMRMTGLPFAEAARRVEELCGGVEPDAIKAPADRAGQVRAMATSWGRSAPLAASPACVGWWMRRVGFVPSTDALRSRGDEMLARVTGTDGQGAQLHRTIIRPDGVTRLLMPGEFPAGSAVRLADPADVLGIAEGIETAVAASVLHDVPVWAALTAGNMAKWEPPLGVRVIVFGDADASFTGQAAAYALAKRLWTKRVDVEVRMADAGDWNDALNATTRRAAA